MKKNNWFLLLSSAIAFGPLACSSKSEGDAEKHQAEAKTAVDTDIDQKQPELSNGTKEEVKTLVEGNNEFAFDLYSRLSKQKGNIIFSPYSISNALAMTYAGAGGETATQMAKVLHFALEQERVHEAFGSLIAQLNQDKAVRPFDLFVVNSLWVQKGVRLPPQALHISRKNYGAGVKAVDFKTRSEEARQEINAWVEKQTKDKIKNLLCPGDVNPSTYLVLANAIYLKATWLVKFPKEETKDAIFEVSHEDKPLVPMMHHADKGFRYFEDEYFQCLELPYAENRLSMVLLLPRNKDELAELERSLTAAGIQKRLSRLAAKKGSVALPRFKMELRTELLNELMKMGMPTFGMWGSGYISFVVHKAFIDVDEVGTEAAAATAVRLGKSSTPARFVFNADHPFLFLIHDKATGSILFIGRVSDPRAVGN